MTRPPGAPRLSGHPRTRARGHALAPDRSLEALAAPGARPLVVACSCHDDAHEAVRHAVGAPAVVLQYPAGLPPSPGTLAALARAAALTDVVLVAHAPCRVLAAIMAGRLDGSLPQAARFFGPARATLERLRRAGAPDDLAQLAAESLLDRLEEVVGWLADATALRLHGLLFLPGSSAPFALDPATGELARAVFAPRRGRPRGAG